jgi:hypothetical protein
MNLIRIFILLLIIEICFIFSCLPSFSQTNYEIQVYASELVKPQQTMFELHSNTTLKKVSDDHLFSQNYFRETVEITHGFNKWFELGSYLFTDMGSEGSTAIVGVHLRPRFAIPAEYNLPVGISLSTEFGYVRGIYSYPSWTLEFRSIIDKKWNSLYLALNPVIALSDDNHKILPAEFEFDMKTSVDVSKKIAMGIEYYGGYGAFNDFLPYRQQQHQVFGVIDVDFGPQWEFNSGLGWSLNQASDRLIIKFIFGRRF